MLYCCGSKDEERERTEKEDVLLKRVAEPSVKIPGNTFASGSEMYGTAGMPELLPPSGVFQPSPHDPCQIRHLAGELLNQGAMDPHSQQQRLGRRAPKLGQIGRSKRGELTLIWEFPTNCMTYWVYATCLVCHGPPVS